MSCPAWRRPGSRRGARVDNTTWYSSFDEVPEKLAGGRISRSMFLPPPEEMAQLHIDRCMRVLPHAEHRRLLHCGDRAQRDGGHAAAALRGRRGSYQVRAGDWVCPRCEATVFSYKTACFKCKTPARRRGRGLRRRRRGRRRQRGGGRGERRGGGGGRRVAHLPLRRRRPPPRGAAPADGDGASARRRAELESGPERAALVSRIAQQRGSRRGRTCSRVPPARATPASTTPSTR